MTYNEFKTKYNIELNPQQEAAVRQTDGPTLVLAVPGSGKTTVVITRLGYMLLCLDIDPSRILSVTYTVAAAADMKNRFSENFGLELASGLQFRTINGVCASIIRLYERLSGKTAPKLVGSDSQFSPVLRSLFEKLYGDWPSESDMKELRSAIAYAKNMEYTSEQTAKMKVCDRDFAPIFDGYCKYMKQSQLMDYDDQLIFAKKILKARPDILDRVRSRCQYVNVDEAQDVSKIQHSIIRILAQGTSNLFMVGDEDQSIYGFRAAYPQALTQFEAQWPGAKVLLMERNYRSTGQIVARAGCFICRNTQRHSKAMVTSNEDGAPIKLVRLADRSRQYKYLAKVAEDCGCSTAVLYRNNDSAIPLIDLLDRENIPCRCRQMESLFFTHYTVTDIVNTLRFAHRQDNGRLFADLYYKLGCGLKKSPDNTAMFRTWPEGEPIIQALIDKGGFEPWVTTRLNNLKYSLARILKSPSRRAVDIVLYSIGYGDYLDFRHADRSKVTILQALADQNPKLPEFLERLGQLSELISYPPEADTPFVLSTIHSSKGLEYDRVFIIDVIDGIFPSIAEPTGDEKLSDDDLTALEEERRLFYVAITRARKQVSIIAFDSDFGGAAKPLSSFITAVADIPKEPKKASPSVKSFRYFEKPALAADKAVDNAADFVPGAKVRHRSYGSGWITAKTGDVVTVSFGGSERKFGLSACLIGGLLTLEKEDK